MKTVTIETDFIKLDQFLKWTGDCSSGAQAKEMIMNGEVKVNGSIEKQRGKKIYADNTVEFGKTSYKVVGKYD